MAGITASRPMGRIRGKDEVSGPRKPKKKGNKPLASMARITASMPMEGIRGKEEVSELRKPKKRGSKPNGLAWQE